MKTFCTHCGCAAVYESQRPKFCGECGYAMGGVAPPQRPSKPAYSEPQVNNSYIDVEDIELDIEVAPKNQGVLFENVAGQAPLDVKFNRKKIGKGDFKKFTEKMTSLIRHDIDDKA